ncbi:MAG: hypothetical protein HYZ72_03430 [Deltaproteobacteria bacterium]|nr:hypothetical protein [Deltaproteobacteria bacterium]
MPLQTLRVNETVTLPVIVKNIGQETWTPRGDPADAHPVNLVYHWIDGPTSRAQRENTEGSADPNPRKKRRAAYLHTQALAQGGKVVVFDGIRTPLPYALPPGESASLHANIQAPAQAGNFTLRLTMVKEGVGWFEERGGQPLDIPVTVTAQ